tara:strand:+ start:309 stop:1484 length:1176 start_codon:yes stop_codon:yes gene_type:complete
MKKKIAILGSTGSIGINTVNILKKDKKNLDIILLTTNINAKKIFQQAKQFKVKNVIITNPQKFLLWKHKFAKNKIKIYNDFSNLNKIFKSKIDYSINAISGIDGLEPTLKLIRYTKKIAIANKESIICGWNLINKELTKNKTLFIPVDSEHFSIYQLIGEKHAILKKIIITASGGPFLNKKNKKKIRVSEALKHPNWRMGKKITIDSATLMNKVFEVIEAKKIFNIKYNNIDIVINPNSYVHAILIFNNGIIKILAHEPNMKIPLFNSIYENKSIIDFNNKLDLNKINNLNFSKPDIKRFKSLKILRQLPHKDSLFETILITTNDELVHMFLNKQIEYEKLVLYLIKIINFKIFKKYYKIRPKSVKQILEIRYLVKKLVHEYIRKTKKKFY